jgi:hypothetical protein
VYSATLNAWIKLTGAQLILFLFMFVSSVCNQVEAECTVMLCQLLINEEARINARNIGIICAYNKQKKLITAMLKDRRVHVLGLT